MTWRSVTFVVWTVLGLATLVVVALAMAGRGRIARPSALLFPVSTHPVVRVLVVLGWMWVGWHFFAR